MKRHTVWDALNVLQGKHAVFFPANMGREGMVVYLIASTTSLWGRTIQAIRLPTALASTATVFVVFWLGRLLFANDDKTGEPTPWRGLLIGGVGAGLMAISLGQTYLGRLAFRTNLLPLFLSLCLAWLWLGWKPPQTGGKSTLAGMCAGLLPYTYNSARLAPFLFLFFGLSFLRPLGPVAWTENPLPNFQGSFLFLGAAALVAAPILLYAALHPNTFFLRGNQLLIFNQLHTQEGALSALWNNLRDHSLAFGLLGNQHWNPGFVGRSILNPYQALFFGLGAAAAIWRWRRDAALRLLLLWTGALTLPLLLARETGSETVSSTISYA